MDDIKPPIQAELCPTTIEELDEKLKSLFYNGDISSVSDSEKQYFIDNVSSSPEIKKFVDENPDHFDLIFGYLGRKSYDADQFKYLLKNLFFRENEKRKNEEELFERVKNKPVAAKEEYILGTYRESIETQARDAVFEFQRKGYKTFESGFGNLVSGAQYIGIRKEGVNIDALRNSLPKYATLIESKDRFQIIFNTRRDSTTEELKEDWDDLASNIPESELKDDEPIDNGLQGVNFREAQDKIKKGENTWLRSGLAYVDGEVVEMSYDDFQNKYGKIVEKNSTGYNNDMDESTPKPQTNIDGENLKNKDEIVLNRSQHFDILNSQLEIADVEANKDVNSPLNEPVAPHTPESEPVFVNVGEDFGRPVAINRSADLTNPSEIVGLKQTTDEQASEKIDVAGKDKQIETAKEPVPVAEAPKVVEVEKTPEEKELQEKINAELDRSRGEYASQLKEWKNELRKKKNIFAKTLSDFGIEKQLPDLDEPQELVNAKNTYLNARAKKFSALNNIPENYNKSGKTFGLVESEVADKKEALLNAIEKEFDALNASIESSLPPLGQGILSKGFKALRKVSPRQRLVISSTLLAGGSMVFGGVGIGAAATYGGYRVAKGLVLNPIIGAIGGVASEAAGKIFDRTFDGVKKKVGFKNKEDDMQEYLSGINAENFKEKEKMLLRAWQRETNAEKRKKLYKLLTMAGAGLGATIEAGSLMDGTSDWVQEKRGNVQEYIKSGGPKIPATASTLPLESIVGPTSPDIAVTPPETNTFTNTSEAGDIEKHLNQFEKSAVETEIPAERILPTEVLLSSKGFIDDMHNLKANILKEYIDKPIPDLIQKNILDKPSLELAKQFGFYDVEHNTSGVGFKGESIGLDENGNVYYEHLKGDKQIMFDAKTGMLNHFDGDYKVYPAEVVDAEKLGDVYPNEQIGDNVTKPDFGATKNISELIGVENPNTSVPVPEPYGIKKEGLDFGGTKDLSSLIGVENVEIPPDEPIIIADEDAIPVSAEDMEVVATPEKRIPLDNGKFVDIREMAEGKVVLYDGVNLAHEELIGDRKILVLNDQFQDGANYTEQRSAFNQAFISDVKADFFGPKPIAESFEGGKIYVTHHVPLTDPDQVRILLNGKEIAQGKIVNGVPELKINPDLKGGWFLVDNSYERAFKHINKLIKTKTFDFTN